MTALLLLVSVLLLLVGHAFRMLRWEQFIRIYERPPRSRLLRGMALGYGLNLLIPFHIGELLRAGYVGRKMKSGTGFALATVIMDRFLDVWFVALGFLCFRALGLGGDAVATAARYYLIFSAVLALGVLLAVLLRDVIKKLCLAVCGLFNDTLSLQGMVFFWSLINTFKDLRRVHLVKLIVNTLLMWATYLGSYAVLAAAIAPLNVGVEAGGDFDTVRLFTLLFGRDTLDFTSFFAGGQLHGLATPVQGIMLLWLLLPPLALWGVTLLPHAARATLAKVSPAAAPDGQYLNLLPQADAHDRAVFLGRYFGLENKDFVNEFIRINQGITILQDYSAGSNATTMLCVDKERTFYRKYAFGEDGDKLAEQLDWLQKWQSELPLCHILRSEAKPGVCWYDMEYSTRAVALFRYLHSNPIEKSIALLKELLGVLDEKLYIPTAIPADAEKAELLEQYITKKVDGNLRLLAEARPLKELMSYDTLHINGRSYRNLPQLGRMFGHDRLVKLFEEDPIGTIHGDLTVENIICRTDGGWYLIDPNTGNLHESPFLDYGKLLQSLHGSYEFMMKTPQVTVQENHIDFALTRSAAYDELLNALLNELGGRYTLRQLQSIWMHEVIHWLRLMPYKLAKDRKRVPMFYAGLVMVANDVAERFPELLKEETFADLC